MSPTWQAAGLIGLMTLLISVVLMLASLDASVRRNEGRAMRWSDLWSRRWRDIWRSR